jgi:uncharacterized protein YdeI (YjbR/CyaY-like superfamily)
MKPVFFRTPAELRKWFERHHASEKELLVGFHKKGSGKPSVTWPESVDEALCVGWIDGIRGSLDEQSYSIRFTPRKPRSVWSAVNVARARELDRKGRMKPAGFEALEARRENRSGIFPTSRGGTGSRSPSRLSRRRTGPRGTSSSASRLRTERPRRGGW